MEAIQKIKRDIERRMALLRMSCADKVFTGKEKRDMVVAHEELMRLLSLIESLEKEPAPKIKGWVARDKDGELELYDLKPYRDKDGWISEKGYDVPINKDMFPDLRWKSEPIEVELTITPIKNS